MATGPQALSDIQMRVFRLLEDASYLDAITEDIPATPASGEIQIYVQTPSAWPVGSRFEISGTEVVQVSATNNGANPITVNRAYEDTYATAHAAGDITRRDPSFLTPTVTEAINVAYTDWCSFHFPKQQWDTATAGAFVPTRWVYQAPADALSVLRVVWERPGFQRYVDLDHGQLSPYPTKDVATGLGFEVFEQGLPGQAVEVLYEKRWPLLVNPTDTIDPDFPAEADDLIPNGAILYIVGVHQTPRFRVDEAMFYREQAAPLPANFNEQWLQRMHQDWYQRAQMIRAKRRGQVPNKIWVGTGTGGV